MAQRIVVGIDGSPAADAALAFALGEARERGVTVEAVTCWHPTYCNGFALTAATDALGAQVLLDRALRRVAPEAVRRHEVVRTVVRGAAASTLADLADGAQLVVVGQGDTRLRARLLWGSLPKDLARRTATPVVVVPAPPASAPTAGLRARGRRAATVRAVGRPAAA